MSFVILQPQYPHYREQFFEGLSNTCEVDYYYYEKDVAQEKNGFNNKKKKYGRKIRSLIFGPVVIYNPFTLLQIKYDNLILSLNFGHLTTWILLLSKFIHRRRIILFGHGISVKRYVNEEKKPSLLLKWMISLSDGVWFYTEKELMLWREKFPSKNMVALNNTVSGVHDILITPQLSKENLKKKYGIAQKTVLIFCARFNNDNRRIDLLIDVIKKLSSETFGFIIIGAGPAKPDFSIFSNVYDYGSLYDENIKKELFQIADIYFQPGWVGLSIVEAMAYGKPIFTFERSNTVLQCVEYYYIKDGFNGRIESSVEDMIVLLTQISETEIIKLSSNAKKYVLEHLSMENMVQNALSVMKDERNNLNL